MISEGKMLERGLEGIINTNVVDRECAVRSSCGIPPGILDLVVPFTGRKVCRDSSPRDCAIAFKSGDKLASARGPG